jgi:hypothetical protein
MRLAAALVCLALGCGKQEKAPAPAAGSAAAGSASGSADPWAKPAVDAADAEAPCNEDEIQAHIDASLKVSMAYLGALETKAKRWGKDCERAKRDLLALEPDAMKFMDSMQEFMTWGRGLSASCGKRVAQLGDRRQETREIEERTPGIEAKVTPILERCKDHPGFAEAAAKPG